MKIIKAIIPLFLTIVLAACSSFTSTPAINPTDLMETSMAMVKTEIVETLTAAPTSTPAFSPRAPSQIPPIQTAYFPTPFDRHDPEAVLRAYFDAWDRQDWVAMASLERERAPEPVGFVRILEIKQISSSPTESVYSVRFEIQVKVQGGSMHSGEYLWTYYLTWDPNRDTWHITNYGY